jgi:hypothetical protein
MSLHPHVITPVPEETARVARAAFPKGHPYLIGRVPIFRSRCGMRGEPELKAQRS